MMSRFTELKDRAARMRAQSRHEANYAAAEAAHAMNDLDPPSRRPRMWDAGMVARKMEEQAGRCALSGEVLTTENRSVDHKIPRSYGGGHEEENLQLTTRTANSRRGNAVEPETLNTYTEKRFQRWRG